MNIIEFILDDANPISGVFAISMVEKPAIESDFVALSADTPIEFKTVDAEKRILMGAVLIPNKMIYRRDKDKEYYGYFSAQTIARASQKYLMSGFQNASTLEHKEDLSDVCVVESWVKEHEVHDKSVAFGLDVPVGSWLVSQKINNDEAWQDYVKTGKVKGFSIEGYFSQKGELMSEEERLIDSIKKILG